MKRLISLLIAFMLCMSIVSFATAATITSNNCQYTSSQSSGGYGKVFYVKTSTKSENKIRFTMGKGTLVPWDAWPSLKCSVYGSYEIKVSYKSGSSWVLETPAHTDIYCRGTYDYTFQKTNTIYKIQVWNWKPQTIADSYIRNRKISGSTFLADGSYWEKFPTCVAKNQKNCTLYNTCP